MFTRRLGRSNIVVSAMGLGTAGIGGSVWAPDLRQDLPVGYGPVDDAGAVYAIQRAVDLGINLFDTADEYGAGHAERLLGRALAGRRSDVIVATKFGNVIADEEARRVEGTDASPAYIRRACEASLRRLDTDYIDLYQLHLRDYPLERAGEVQETLEDLVTEGKIRFYGWSTDDLERARFFAQGAHCTAVQHRLNLLIDNPEMLALCEEEDLASINRIPLLMGILTGKHRDGVNLPPEDVRSEYFQGERVEQDIERVERLREVFAAGGRTPAQGALGWIWARSERTVPIPGFKNAHQVEENVAAMDLGPLSPEQMAQVDEILGR